MKITAPALALLGLCVLGIGCPSPRSHGTTGTGPINVSGTGTGTGATGSHPLPPEPTPPRGVAKATCTPDAAGRPCDVSTSDDGSVPTPVPCQDPRTGQCDMTSQPVCLFVWKSDGQPCNNGLGTCQAHHCKCSSPRSCGYDCTATCN